MVARLQDRRQVPRAVPRAAGPSGLLTSRPAQTRPAGHAVRERSTCARLAARLDSLDGKALALLRGHLANRERAFIDLTLDVLEPCAALLGRALRLRNHAFILAAPVRPRRR